MQPGLFVLTEEHTRQINRWLWLFSHEIVSNVSTYTRGRWTRNVLASGTRLLASVGLPTIVRHGITHLLEQSLGRTSRTDRIVASATTALVPLVWTGGALAADWHDGGTTRTLRISRAIALLGGVATLGWAVESEAATVISSGMIGALLYSVLRDLVQMVFTAPDNTRGLDARAIVGSGMAYSAAQMAGGEVSARYFPTGNAETGEWNWQGALAGASFNILLECVDDLIFRSMQRAFERADSDGRDIEGLRVRLQTVLPSGADFRRSLVGVAPARAMLITTAAMGAQATSQELQRAMWSPELTGSISNVLGNLIVLVGYVVLFGQLIRRQNSYGVQQAEGNGPSMPMGVRGTLTAYRPRGSNAPQPGNGAVPGQATQQSNLEEVVTQHM
ncbi:hypothetical protein EC912_102131 [Luteibacter rhizovicinus]|uniref:Uncharacterized protein n=1 Tax=Luteibacter rhizovicinus TaxID=242606 RepID=A0A4R3YSA6_9GAMM|nr:hypothetical protein [Luteibacter rhizovicinus]TCV95787.1 hypothetical protein EC912_102131 [Luteibacter rhizovicinus]